MSPTIRSDARHPTINATTVILEPSDPLRNHHCHHKENFKRCERREIEGEREREREREMSLQWCHVDGTRDVQWRALIS